MAIVTISRGTFSGGQSLAEAVAEKLGYRCISREVLVEAARQYDVVEEKLTKALSEKPKFLERLSLERIHYLSYIRATLCKEVKDCRVVYHGHVGHLLLRGVPGVLKVKVIINIEARIKAAMDRYHLGREWAQQFISKVDDERAKRTRFLYNVDWNDPSLYDIVINLDNISLASASEIVCGTAGLGEFQVTPDVLEVMDDLILSTGLRAEIAKDKGIADAQVMIEAHRDIVTIGGIVDSTGDADKVREIVKNTPGVKEINSKMQVRSYR